MELEHNEEWHERRQSCLGGSDVGGLFGLGFGCPRRLHYDKAGTTPDFPDRVDNHHVRRGQLLEPVAAALYAAETGSELTVVGQKVMDDRPHLGVNADRLVMDPLRGREFTNYGVMEIKCPAVDNFRGWESEGFPDYYLLQLQHGMLVWGLSWGVLVAFSGELAEMFSQAFEADPVVHEKIVESGDRFWRNLKAGGEPPARLERGDRRCGNCPWRLTCWEGQDGAWEPGSQVENDPAVEGLLVDYEQAVGWRDEAEARVERVRKELSSALGRRKSVRTPLGQVQVVESTVEYVRYKELLEAYPDVARRMRRSSPKRSLVVRVKRGVI